MSLEEEVHGDKHVGLLQESMKMTVREDSGNLRERLKNPVS